MECQRAVLWIELLFLLRYNLLGDIINFVHWKQIWMNVKHEVVRV